MQPTTLSKSRFKLALECRRKLVYLTDPAHYPNSIARDEFRAALALGGHAVGELARRLHPLSIPIAARSTAEQLAETQRQVQRAEVTLCEAAFAIDNLLVRVDLLKKSGKAVRLIEVKSKSFDPTAESFRGKRGAISAEWLPYLADIAFQTHVLRACHPEWRVTPSLMLIDPRARSSIDGLGNRIRVQNGAAGLEVIVDPHLRLQELTDPLLREYEVGGEVEEILAGNLETAGGPVAFLDFVRDTAERLRVGEEFAATPHRACKTCEFYVPPAQSTPDHRSGWAECMTQALQTGPGFARAESVFSLYQDHGMRKGSRILQSGRSHLAEVRDRELGARIATGKISSSHRQLLQVRGVRDGAPARLLRKAAIRRSFAGLKFPLHFIDFETARPVLPFHAGRKPNQQILFQYSHHTLSADGRLAHAGEGLVSTPGIVPNAPILRALASALSADRGTVVHWWTHERTVLREVSHEIEASAEPDRAQLIGFVHSLLGDAATPPRLFDLGALIAGQAFFNGTAGSSSIKKVLPAVLGQSAYLQARYGQPIYGTAAMPSKNFGPAWTWLRRREGALIDPYELLGPVYTDPTWQAALLGEESESEETFIHGGGAATVAYAELQRPDLPATERTRYERQLLRYCELDTLAMVMVYEALREWLGNAVPVRSARRRRRRPSAC